ncbi:MAG TPA: alpha/beta hydrolase [Actinomycetota bacterium]|nr:alpha/beta hydrolase [Actinomycetota bacterium]
MAKRGRAIRGLSYAALTVTGLALLPPVQARGKAVAVLADAIGLPFPRPAAAPVSRVVATIGGVPGDLYSPGQPAPAIVLIPGAAPGGKDDPRVIRVARALARAKRVVFVPTLELAERRFVDEDIDRIARCTAALADHQLARGRVTLLGFSYGGSFGLVAAADPRLDGKLAQVAVFGAYYDLIGLVQAVTTGVSLVDGRRIPWQGHPMAQPILRARAVTLAPGKEQNALLMALEDESPEGLSPRARAIYDLLVNEDPARTFDLAARLPRPARDLLSRFSPSSVASQIDVPVVAMHSTDDPAVPFGEALRLERGIPGTRLVNVEVFRHVDFSLSSPNAWLQASDDLWNAWRFTSWILAAQE